MALIVAFGSFDFVPDSVFWEKYEADLKGGFGGRCKQPEFLRALDCTITEILVEAYV